MLSRKRYNSKKTNGKTFKKKMSGGAVPPGIMRQVAKSHLLVGCYANLQQNDGCDVDNMTLQDLFRACGEEAALNEDPNEGQKSINQMSAAASFNFWTLEGWLNWLNSTGAIKGRRIIKSRRNVANIILKDGTKLGDAKNANLQLAIIGSTEKDNKKGLQKIFRMTVESYLDQHPELSNKGIKNLTLKEVINHSDSQKKSFLFPWRKASEDEECTMDTPMNPDSFENTEVVEIPEKHNYMMENNLDQKEAVNFLKQKLQGGKSKRKTYKKKKKSNKTKKFLYNPNNPKKSFDVYIDKDPSDTIPINYTTTDDVKNTINKLERLYKSNKYTHKRIWQVGMIMKVRLQAMLKHKNTLYKKAKNVKSRFNLANKYFIFLGKRTKIKSEKDRKNMVFVF